MREPCSNELPAVVLSPICAARRGLSLEVALRDIDLWPVIPVVSRADFGKLEGLISKRAVLERYGLLGDRNALSSAAADFSTGCSRIPITFPTDASK